jgi:hypothetical protein
VPRPVCGVATTPDTGCSTPFAHEGSFSTQFRWKVRPKPGPSIPSMTPVLMSDAASGVPPTDENVIEPLAPVPVMVAMVANV